MIDSLEQLRNEIQILRGNNIDTDELVRIADAIEREVEERYIELPKDADGEYIRIGDMMDKGEVTCIRDCGKGWEVVLNDLYTYDLPSLHHHTPTVKDVLREFFEEVGDGLHTLKAIDTQVIIAKYAEKLQLKEAE